jgi:hypothetical protein
MDVDHQDYHIPDICTVCVCDRQTPDQDQSIEEALKNLLLEGLNS